MNTEQELIQVKDAVEQILAQDERARNDDKWLTYKVMSTYTKIFIPFEDFRKIPSFDSIRRTRQKIQNEELRFLPTNPEVIKKRQKREVEVRQWALNN